MKGVCLTGNRPHKMPFPENSKDCDRLKGRICETVIGLIGDGYSHFISGMALGADTYFAECIIMLKKSYNIFLEAAIPFQGQSGSFDTQQKSRYQNILNAADKITVLSEQYTKYCMVARNRYMVDSSDIVLSICYSSSGGSVSTVRYAQKKEKRIINLII